MGAVDSSVASVGIAELRAEPASFVGQRVRTRGYFILEHEKIALLEPRERKQRLVLQVQDLPAGTAEQVRACRLKLVDVVGKISAVSDRSGETLLLEAESMVGAAGN